MPICEIIVSREHLKQGFLDTYAMANILDEVLLEFRFFLSDIRNCMMIYITRGHPILERTQ